MTYIHNDHLGSAQSGTATNGVVIWRERYSPFGSELIGNAANDNQSGFTGHIKDGATGLNYMQARYYDPVIGRFLSVDPVGFLQTGQTGMFNRYAYTLNDPVNFVDPDGEQASNVLSIYREQSRSTGQGQGQGQIGGAIDDFKNNLNDMIISNAIGNDKFFHCKANCQATKRGSGGEAVAIAGSTFREIRQGAADMINGTSDPADTAADVAANRQGRAGAKSDPSLTCSAICSNFIVPGINDNGNFTQGEPVPNSTTAPATTTPVPVPPIPEPEENE